MMSYASAVNYGSAIGFIGATIYGGYERARGQFPRMELCVVILSGGLMGGIIGLIANTGLDAISKFYSCVAGNTPPCNSNQYLEITFLALPCIFFITCCVASFFQNRHPQGYNAVARAEGEPFRGQGHRLNDEL